MILKDLYKKVSDIPIGDFPPSALSSLLHGYLSVYSMVRVNPWLEEVYDSQWNIHGRVREIAGELADLVQDPSIALEDRVGHVADLMECYLVYSDMDFLDIALDVAYGIISKEGSREIVLPCRTAEMCRLLCSCYYFTNEEKCAELAGDVLREKIQGNIDKIVQFEDAEKWIRVLECYKNTIGGEIDFIWKYCSPNGEITYDLKEGENDLSLVSKCFEHLVMKENELFKS